jgi:molecular chaperone DnaK (HSP70)
MSQQPQAMGAGLPAGSKLLVVDLGGGTLDLSLVALEGGEGKGSSTRAAAALSGDETSKTASKRCARQGS